MGNEKMAKMTRARMGSGLHEDIVERIDDAVLVLREVENEFNNAKARYGTSPSIANGSRKGEAFERLVETQEKIYTALWDKWDCEWRERLTKDEMNTLIEDSITRIMRDCDDIESTKRYLTEGTTR